jgi:hypothetical protein
MSEYNNGYDEGYRAGMQKMREAGQARITELEAELAKVVGFIQNFALRAMIEEHDEDERDMIDFDSLRFERDCDIVQARSILAELKGETE